MKCLVLTFFLATGAVANSTGFVPLPSARAPQITSSATDAVNRLIGLSEGATATLLGTPLIARSEGLGAMWTYQQPSCVLFVFFGAASPSDARAVRGITSGPRQRGDTIMSPAECLAVQLDLASPEPEHKGTYRPGG